MKIFVDTGEMDQSAHFGWQKSNCFLWETERLSAEG